MMETTHGISPKPKERTSSAVLTSAVTTGQIMQEKTQTEMV